MKNSIEKMTGATISARQEGESLLVFVNGAAGAVLHAGTLLYNYGAFENFPEYVDHSSTSIMYRTPVDKAAKGLCAYVLNSLECAVTVASATALSIIENWMVVFRTA